MSGFSFTESARSVLRVLAAEGALTRPRLGEVLNLSKPTLSAAVAELENAGLVTVAGRSKGAVGRSATIYRLGQAAGYVVGLDVGAAQIRGIAHELDGTSLAAVETAIPRGMRSTDEIAALLDTTAHAVMAAAGRGTRAPRCVAVAVPRIVTTRPLALNRRKPPDAVLHQLRRGVGAPIILENNVNCAAVAEMRYGAAQSRRTFVYLQIGVRVGLGLVLNGMLFRGFNGAAGEIGRLPFPWSESEVPVREGLEAYLGSEALLDRARSDWPAAEGSPPQSAQALFERAEQGSAAAALWAGRHAQDVGRVVAACVGLLDPELVVLGGGVGQNRFILDEVRRMARELTWPTEVAVTALGSNATVLGAVRLAADHALAAILGVTGIPHVVLPAIEPGMSNGAA